MAHVRKLTLANVTKALQSDPELRKALMADLVTTADVQDMVKSALADNAPALGDVGKRLDAVESNAESQAQKFGVPDPEQDQPVRKALHKVASAESEVEKYTRLSQDMNTPRDLREGYADLAAQLRRES